MPSHTSWNCGLYPIFGGGAEAFPLINTKVRYDLVDVYALATVTQTYVSDANVDLDVKYVFPLPPDASVCAFKAAIDGQRTIKGVVKGKQEAKAKYDAAVNQGKTAALLSQDNVEIFQLSLGNIRPGQTIEIHISLATVISHNGELDSLRLTFPCVIAPRYGTPPNQILNYLTQSWPCRHVVVGKFKSAIEFSLSVQMTSHIKSVLSPSHMIEMKLGQSTSESTADFDPFKAHVSFTSPTLLDKDIVIAMSCVGLDKPRCTVEAYSPAEGAQEFTHAYALTLVPRFELPPLPSQEYIFLVDRSGSMRGGKMEAVRSALQIILRSLPSQGTSFNIISFGSNHTSLWPSSVPYTAESVKHASQHVDEMTANYGGTYINRAIEFACQSRSNLRAPASIFVLTDGQTYEIDNVQITVTCEVNRAKWSNTLLRLFCMGIGDTVSKAMCDMIARIGKGIAVYVGETEKPDHKLMTLLRAARGSVVQNISIDWGVPEECIETSKDVDDFELVSSEDAPSPGYPKDFPPMSFFDVKAIPNIEEEKFKLGPSSKPVGLPPLPRIQQAPASLPPLYPGSRTSIFAIIKSNKEPPSKAVHITGMVLGKKVQLEVPVFHSMVLRASADEKKIKLLHVLAARALVQRFEDEAKVLFLNTVNMAEALRVAERYGIASSQTSFVAIDEESTKVGYSVDKEQSSFFGTPKPGGGSALFGSALFASGFKVPAQHSVPSPLSPPPPPCIPLLPTMLYPSKASVFASASVDTKPPLMGLFEPFKPTAAPPVNTASLFASTSGAMKPPLMGSFEPFKPVASPVNTASVFASTSGATPNLTGLFEEDEVKHDYSMEFRAMLRAQGVEKSSRPSPPIPDYLGRAKMVIGDSVGADTEQAAMSVLRSAPPDLSSRIETFARLQDFEGFFPPSASLYKLLVKSPEAPPLPVILKQAGKDAGAIWCTILCVVYLEAAFKGEQDIWAFLVEKALLWVENALQPVATDGVSQTRDALKEEAKKIIKV